ncbi:hypothetical protein HPB48_015421 [Haemaphysalis longicornis]|uniref:CCHC-type domain-containing protein n=1 Tax=Haemaphysalis longicornis TaxID=44386 RepID=A0A9J6GZH8_HAELO|nr:hypothetical protein HPB48_015421 [Haemaphysalis longicornis]
MATAMRVEVDGIEIDPEACTRANGWRTAGEKIKKSDGDVAAMSPTPGNGGGRAKATPDGVERVTRPPINKCKLLRKARMPELPRGDMKIIVRPRGGLRVGAVTRVELSRAITAAAQVAAEDARGDVVCPNSHQNILVISTPRRGNADRYNAVERIDVRGTTYEVCAYEAAPHGTVKGVIRDIPLEDSSLDIQQHVVHEYNPTALQANRIGKSRSVVIAFAGRKVPRYVRYGNLLTECTLYRKQIEACQACGRLGHRLDVCPDPTDKICRGCGTAGPAEDHACEPKWWSLRRQPHHSRQNLQSKIQDPFHRSATSMGEENRRTNKNGDEAPTAEVLQADPNGTADRDRRRPLGALGVVGAAAPGRNLRCAVAPAADRGALTQGRCRVATATGRRRGEERLTARSGSRRRNELEDGEASARRRRSRSKGRPGDQRGPATKKVGWASRSPKMSDSEFPPLNSPSTPPQSTTKENAEIAELKQIIAKQNAHILEQNAQIKGLMNKIEQLVTRGPGQGALKDQAQIPAAEGPRKMPCGRSPPPTSSTTQAQHRQEAMEAEDTTVKELATQPPAEEQKQLTHGETVILTALSRIEDRLGTLEVKYEKHASRIAALEIRMRSMSLKKERMGRIKEAIAKRRGRLEVTNSEDNDLKPQAQ